MARAADVGVLQAVTETGVPEPTLRGWLKRGDAARSKRDAPRQYDNAFRARAVKSAGKLGPKAVAQKLGIPYQTLVRWCREPQKQRRLAMYSPATREEAVTRAKASTCRVAGEELGIPPATIRNWLDAQRPIGDQPSRGDRRIYTAHEVEQALQLVKTAGVIRAADDLGIPESTLRKWEMDQRPGATKKPRRSKTYSDEQRRRAVQAVCEHGYDVASAEFDVSKSLLRKWARKQGVKSPIPVGEHAAFDDKLRWLPGLNPELEEWRSLAEAWLASVVEAIPPRLNALSSLFKGYIHKEGLTTSPAEFLSRFANLPPTIEAFPDSRHGKVCRNYASQFLDWVLVHRFSEVNDRGHTVVDPLFRNPLGKASFAGDSYDDKSPYDPLPYYLLVECRRIIAQGPTFKDWIWAQSQLGVDIGKQGGTAPEWFEVHESQIDRNDPDCVWRRRARARTAGGPRYEIWSPVRWVAQLVNVILPFRTTQVRLLDSGEADTWTYAIVDGKGVWAPNKSAIRSGTVAKPTQQGVFRRPANELRDSEVNVPEGWSNAVLYCNTNKTADSKKSGSRKGYVVPWVCDGGLENDVFYWLCKLRDWQIKYNSVTRRTSWKELDGRHIGKKSEIQLAGFPDTSFFFGCPRSALVHLTCQLQTACWTTPGLQCWRSWSSDYGSAAKLTRTGSPYAWSMPTTARQSGRGIHPTAFGSRSSPRLRKRAFHFISLCDS